MTEREAVKKLKNMRLFMQLEDNKNECKFTEDDYKANEMAIQALGKQIATSSQQKIYRENEGMSENVYKAGYKFGYKKAIDEYTEYLKEIGKTGTDGWVPCFTPNSWKDDFLTKRNKGGSGI